MIPAQELDRALVMLKTIWYALAGSLVMYVIAIPFFLRDRTLTLAAETYEELRVLLYLAAGLTLAASWLTRRLLLAGKASPPKTKESRSRQHPMIQRYTTAMIVALAMCEAIAIYGLVLFLLGKNQIDLVLLTALAAAGMLGFFPKKPELIDLAKKYARNN